MDRRPLPPPGEDRPATRSGDRRPVPRPDDIASPGSSASARPYVPAEVGYVPSQLAFEPAQSAEEQWYALPAGVRERLAVPSDDEVVHWWATKHNAAMFRRRRLILAEPLANHGSGRWEVRSYDLDPSSFEVYQHLLPVDPLRKPSQPASSAGRAAPLTGSSAPPPVSRPEGTAPLPEVFRGYLGNLPLKAQAALQLPFSRASTTPTAAFTYRFTESNGASKLTTMCLIANRMHVTFMYAERHLPSGTTMETSWAGSAPWHATLYHVRGMQPRDRGAVVPRR